MAAELTLVLTVPSVLVISIPPARPVFFFPVIPSIIEVAFADTVDIIFVYFDTSSTLKTFSPLCNCAIISFGSVESPVSPSVPCARVACTGLRDLSPAGATLGVVGAPVVVAGKVSKLPSFELRPVVNRSFISLAVLVLDVFLSSTVWFFPPISAVKVF